MPKLSIYIVKRLMLLLAVAALAPTCLAASPQRDYASTAAKAQRFFQYKEWANAAAMYEIMLEDSAKVVDTYARAIAVAGMRGMPDYEMSLLERAQKELIPMDSVLSGVQRVTFAMGHTSLYENFLLLVKERQPWLTRSIEKQLLRYYIFRRNASEIVRYSKIMLSGAPDNAGFLTSLADGYMLGGDEEEAIGVYMRLLELHPDNYNALLNLGNYYRLKGDTAKAATYLRRANEIIATPYVTTLLEPDTGDGK